MNKGATNSISLHYKQYIFMLQTLYLYTTNSISLRYKQYIFMLQTIYLYTTNNISLCYKQYTFTLQTVYLYATNNISLHYKQYIFTLQTIYLFIIATCFKKRIIIGQENLKIQTGQCLKHLHFLLMWRRACPYKFLWLYNTVLFH